MEKEENASDGGEIERDSERLKNVLKALDISAAKLSRRLNYQSAGTIYHVINGINKISLDMATRIVEKYPEINFLYLLKGMGEVVNKDQSKIQKNIFDPEPSHMIDLHKIAAIPRTLDDQKDILDDILDELKQLNENIKNLYPPTDNDLKQK